MYFTPADVVVHSPFIWTVPHLLIAIVMIAACVALVYIALREFKIQIPQWVVQVFWIVLVAVVVIMAIRIVTGV